MNAWMAVVFGFLSIAVAGASDLPLLTAENGEPVTPESLGGCSMKCTFHWSVTAQKKSERAPVPVKTLNDERADTTWTDASGGVGARLMFHFPEHIPAEMEGNVPFYGIDFINGDASSALAWKNCAHIKKARLSYNGKAIYNIVFPNITRRWATVSFDDVMVHSGDTVTLEILETYRSSASSVLALSEVKLQGAH